MLLQLGLDRAGAVPPEFRATVAAIGSFDGVHLGHQALIARVKAVAGRIGAAPAILTFEPHPRAVLRPDQALFRLTPADVKRRVAEAAGISRVIEMRFEPGLSALTADEFVQAVLVDRLRVAAVVVGQDFRYGKGRTGDVTTLTDAGRRLGFRVETVLPVADAAGVIISSGRVRDALAAGRIAEANALLGYRWMVSGTVIHGDKRGRELGFPTANVSLPPTNALRHGIYAVTVSWDGERRRPAVASFGVRPTFGGSLPLLEPHIFDFDGDLYGKTIHVSFVEWLRPEERFASIDALVRQIKDDARRAGEILRSSGPGTDLDVALAERIVAADSGIA